MEHPGCGLGQGAGQGAGTRSSWHSRAAGHSRGWPALQVPGEAGGEPGVPRARPELAKPARAASGQPYGCWRLPRARLGATAGHREQGRQRDAPRLGTASEWGWKQVAVTSCYQPVSPGWDSEGCHLGTSPAPSTPQHGAALPSQHGFILPHTSPGRGLGCALDPAPHPLGCCAHGGPLLSTPFPLQGDHPAV